MKMNRRDFFRAALTGSAALGAAALVNVIGKVVTANAASTSNVFLPLAFGQPGQSPTPQPAPTSRKLIFIHHSTGENWLADHDGGLGKALAQNGYFVSDTNYTSKSTGSLPIWDTTDIGHWWNWFLGPEASSNTSHLFKYSGRNSAYTRMESDPGGENEIIMFKSCYPNSNISGQPDDGATNDLPNPIEGKAAPSGPGDTGYYTVANIKRQYLNLLDFFSTRPDKLFVIICAPPLRDVETNPTLAANARAVNNWLHNGLLTESNYTTGNVKVFDFFNVLTHFDNHHMMANGVESHITDRNSANYLAYPSADTHPNTQGNQKAAAEFVPLLNYFYQQFKAR